MKKRPINLYSHPNSEAHIVATTLAENLTDPAQVHNLVELPAPDTRRPTLQQLRTERAGLEREMTAGRDLLQIFKSSPRLAEQAEFIRQEMVRHNDRIQEIDQVLGQEGGVPV